ncbi:MAG: beta-hydroxyacyl-ACP dehydratase [Planctomycetales bacterium]|nr:beta-hydroxyacyl-ACP dehydratase [Planctomycetales bacterium]MCA9181498.1 beta-hydroxyacyl-ACP dehydratase [Planctomycetales bacterium]
MRFLQLDKITLLEPGARIEAYRTLGADEDYLQDHFPRFPVMPGVLMLEALFQAAAILVRATEEYRSGLVLLREAKNVKFADFLQPGQTLKIVAQIVKMEGPQFVVKATGSKGDATAVSGRLIIDCQNNVDGHPDVIDQLAAKYIRDLAEHLQGAAIVRR